MKYEAPRIIDLGTIAEHTFTNAGGGVYDGPGKSGATPPKDSTECKFDAFGEYSCSGS